MPLFEKDSATVSKFWARVDRSQSNGCWPWIGGREKSGYGVFHLPGRKTVRASRYSLFLAIGDYGDGWALHKCDNRPCVNPDHLYAGTVGDNVRDAVERGRFKRFYPRADYRPRNASFQELLRVGIIRIRESRGLGQKQLQGLSGVYASTWSDIETGRRVARPNHVDSLSASLGISLSDFLYELIAISNDPMFRSHS